MPFIGKYILDILDFAGVTDEEKALLISQSGETLEDLGKEGHFASYNSVERILDAATKVTSDEYLGLHMGEQISLASTKYVDQMMASSPSLQVAFETAVAYSSMISDSMDCHLEMQEQSFKVVFELNPDWAVHSHNAVKQNLDVALLCALKSLQRLTASEYYPVSVQFFYPRPRNWNEHYRLFNCKLQFTQPVSSISFDKRFLKQELKSGDEGLLESLKANAQSILSKLPLQGRLSYEVKKVLLQEITPDSKGIEHHASALNLSARSLQRRLKEEGTTFKNLQTEMREKLAGKMLKEGHHAVSEVAYLLGFSEPSAFVRAFKTWTGVTPKKFMSIRH